jgi:antitoxin ParD1/3/4/toxin ParE1/3/4
MKRFVLTRPAERDLEQIKIFLVQEAGPVIARRVLKDIRSALEFLGNEPGAGHVREDLTSRPLKFWPVYSYLIVYDPVTKPVQIMRVLHGMRDVEEILN